jgi:hypothetical protein
MTQKGCIQFNRLSALGTRKVGQVLRHAIQLETRSNQKIKLWKWWKEIIQRLDCIFNDLLL